MHLQSVFRRVETGDQAALPHPGTVFRADGGDDSRDRERQRAAPGSDQAAVADQFALEIATPEGVDRHLVVFDAVLHPVGRSVRFVLFRFAAAPEKRGAEHPQRVLFHGEVIL